MTVVMGGRRVRVVPPHLRERDSEAGCQEFRHSPGAPPKTPYVLLPGAGYRPTPRNAADRGGWHLKRLNWQAA